MDINANELHFQIREAVQDDFCFVVGLMVNTLDPYYGGDHEAHAKRIFSTHISGGRDRIGHFSFEQKMFIITANDEPAGMLHLVGKRQGTYKISPIIVSPKFRGKLGIGSSLLKFAENYAHEHGSRQIYCTVADQNHAALQFFLRNGYIIAGRSDSHYKPGITELMLYKLFISREYEERFDKPHISVVMFEEHYESQVRELLLEHLPKHFEGITSQWIDALFEGYRRRNTDDINQKYKLIYLAIDRSDKVLGVAGATPKKGRPIKLMPFIATNLPAFVALLYDIPYELKRYGHKLYMHIAPSVEETIALQKRGWVLDAAMPAAYHEGIVTQQWSLTIGENFMRFIRVKQRFIDLIKQGKKTIEVRVGYSNIKTIQPGERIKLASRSQEQIICVKNIRQYKTFKEMLSFEDYRRIAPDLSSEDELLQLLGEIYPPNKEKLGVIALEIEEQIGFPWAGSILQIEP